MEIGGEQIYRARTHAPSERAKVRGGERRKRPSCAEVEFLRRHESWGTREGTIACKSFDRAPGPCRREPVTYPLMSARNRSQRQPENMGAELICRDSEILSDVCGPDTIFP